ncbi:MAG: SurA N-terminal domain-containing protein [Xanthobacteraceae bacterium]
MLEALRKSAGGTVAKIFIGLLVLSFAIWGIGDVFRGFGSRDLAQIGPVKIDIENFRQLYQDRLQQLSRELGRGITPDQARTLGLDRQLLGEIVSETTLDVKATQLGLNIDNQTLLAHIHANPAFRGATGAFDPNRFYEILRSAGFSEARYVDSERRLILRQQLARALGGDIAAPQVVRDAVRRFEGEQRTVEYVVLDRNAAGAIPAPTPAEIDTYFADRKSAFRAPEYRKIVAIALTPETLAADVKISDAELRKVYEERRNRLATPERREVEQIVFPNAADAQAASQRLTSGAKFEEIVAARGLKPGDVALGLVAKREILDSAVADAVFALPPGEVSKPITGRFGTVIARVNKIEPGKEPAFAEVAETLRKEMALGQARNALLDQHDRIEDERASGARLGEVAAKLGIKAITIDAVDRSGRAPDGKPIENVTALGELISGAFTAEVGVETDPVEIDGGNGYVWYEVTEITPARERTLDEVRDHVEARWKDEQIAKRLAERAGAIRTRLDAGDGFDKAAPGLKMETRDKIQRGRPVDGLDRSTLAAVFDTAQGKSGVGTAEDAVGRVVFRVTVVTTPPAAEAASQRVAELATGIQDDILVQYVLHLQQQLGVSVNQTALRTVTGGGDTGN